MSYDLDRGIDEFHRRLHALTPLAVATTALLAANVAVYLVMAARGDNGLWADARRLVAWGANYGPATRAEWWRLLTSVFLHGGLLHLALNMLALRSGGPLLERSLGTARYLAVYVLTAASASLASVLVSGHGVSVGASGPIFGVYGTLLGIALRHAPREERWAYLKPAWRAPRLTDEEARRAADHGARTGATTMPAYVARLLSTQIVGLVILNVLIGLLIPQIDNAAHVAGFASGLALGWLGAGAVSARLAAAPADDGPHGGPGLQDRSGWLVPAATAVIVVLASNAVFPLLPAAARLSLLDAGCRVGSGAACLAAGNEVRTSARGRVTPLVLGYLERGCRAGNGAACTAWALGATASPGGAATAARALASACALGDVFGCRMYAGALEAGQGLVRDVGRAMQVYGEACEREDGFSCLRLAEAALQGRGVPRDPARGLTLARRACTHGEPRGCTLEGAQRAAAKDVPGALRAFERACRAGEPIACTELGARYETGNGVPEDPKRAAIAYYELACVRGIGVACTRAGRLFERAPEVRNEPKAAAMYETGCRLAQAESCFNLGVMYAEGRGRARDPQRALAFYEQACARGLKQVCGLVAQLKQAP